MQGSQSTPPYPLAQSWLGMRPKPRGSAATSLSFPAKPSGARQLPPPFHAVAIHAYEDLYHFRSDRHLHHRYHHHHTPPVHTVDVEDNIAIHDGSHSFTFPHGHQTQLYESSLSSQFSDDLQFANFSDSLSKHTADHDRIYSLPIAFTKPHQRSLTFNHNTLNDEMTTTITAPNSPPDLSGSKSSKSSSSRSSQFDGPDDITKDVSHFEEIGLGGESQVTLEGHAAWDPNGWGKRSSSRVSLIGARPIVPARDLTSSHKRPTYPSLQGQVQQVLSNKGHNTGHLPGGGGAGARGLKRGFTAPSSATLPMPTPGCPSRTRSSSPSPKQPASASFITAGHNVRSGHSKRSTGPPDRRGSWQPSRKTTKELEAEYHDSDDELPADTSLWNVPMSPRPSIAQPSSTRSSNRGSPERDAIRDMPPAIPISHAISDSESPPRHRPPPRTSSLEATAFAAQLPASAAQTGCFDDTRANSWTLAMAELSEEARVLTETLEYHADMQGRLHEQNVQNGVKSTRPSLESNEKRTSRTKAIELPPLQKGNLLIDPMPVSKEKAAVLTRTRPSWLPPKDPKEEKRHLREYQRMMAASLDAEKKKEDMIRVQQCERDDTRESLNRIWEQYVCPDWDRVTHEHRTRELWWRGISPKVRGRVWMRAMGNSLGLSHTSYEMARRRVGDVRRSGRSVEDVGGKEGRMRGWFADIERDAGSAFPQLKVFQRDGPMWRDLVDVCCAYVAYRSDVGYLYGIQLIAALMLLQLPAPADVFILLANCLNGTVALAFLTNDPGATTKALDQMSASVLCKLPRLHQYLFQSVDAGGLGMHPAEVFEPMLRTHLTNGLDVEKLVRVWDCFVFEGDRIMVRAAVALLGSLQAQIFGLEGSRDEKRRMVRELLSWGPAGWVAGSWDVRGDADSFMAEVKEAGRINGADG